MRCEIVRKILILKSSTTSPAQIAFHWHIKTWSSTHWLFILLSQWWWKVCAYIYFWWCSFLIWVSLITRGGFLMVPIPEDKNPLILNIPSLRDKNPLSPGIKIPRFSKIPNSQERKSSDQAQNEKSQSSIPAIRIGDPQIIPSKSHLYWSF